MKKEELVLHDSTRGFHYRGATKVYTVDYKTAQAVKHTAGDIFVMHSDGTKWTVHSKAFSSVPQSVALDLFDMDGLEILSNEEAKRFIDQAAKIALEANSDIIEYNKMAQGHNERNKGKDDFVPMVLKKLRRGPPYTTSPYALYMEWKAEQEKPKVAETVSASITDKVEEIVGTVKRKSKRKKE